MLKTCHLSKHSGLHTKMCKSSTDCTVNTDRCLNLYCFYYFQGLLSISRGWKPAVIPERPASPPTGLPQQQHPATEPEEEHEEEESPHPRQLDHHPGAAGSRLEVAGREEDLQPSAVCDHGVIWGQRGGGRRERGKKVTIQTERTKRWMLQIHVSWKEDETCWWQREPLWRKENILMWCA